MIKTFIVNLLKITAFLTVIALLMLGLGTFVLGNPFIGLFIIIVSLASIKTYCESDIF